MPAAKRLAALPVAALAQHAEAASRLLRALSNPHRLMVLCVLSEGELAVGELNQRVSLSQSALSQHLAVLREDGLVTTRREGQAIHYRLAPGPAIEVIRTLHDQFCCSPQPKPRK